MSVPPGSWETDVNMTLNAARPSATHGSRVQIYRKLELERNRRSLAMESTVHQQRTLHTINIAVISRR